MTRKKVDKGDDSEPFLILGTLLSIFAISGAACLIYEVVWVRQLTTVLGASSYAVSIVLCSFMSGLGLGAWLIGRKADSWTEAYLARTYVALEIGIGLYALLFPYLIKGIERTYVLFYQWVNPTALNFQILKLSLAFTLLFIPTIFMGATMPVLSRYLIRRRGSISLRVSWLYAANTSGAILGIIMAGYLMLPTLGILRTTLTAVLLNFTAAFSLWYCHRLFEEYSQSSGPKLIVRKTPVEAMTSSQKLLATAFALSGMAAMFYEVSWTRTLIMVLGNTTFAFTTMLATFLAGIAGGSALYTLIPKKINRMKLFAFLQLLAGLTAILSIPFFEKLPILYLYLHENFIDTWSDMQLIRFVLAALVMLPPTVALGATFPSVSALLVDKVGQIGERLGKAYAINTGGAVLGSALAGLTLIPLIGMQNTLILGSLTNILAAALIWFSADFDITLSRRVVFGSVTMIMTLTAAYLIQPWSPRVLNSGVYLYAARYENMEDDYHRAAQSREKIPRLDSWRIWELAMKQYDLLYYNPGPTATVGVMEGEDGVRFLTIDGKTDASTGAKSDMNTQVMIGQLPMLFHNDPDKTLVVGLGSGVTAGSVLTHDVRMVDCAEISPAVVKAASYFKKANHNALADPRFRIIPRDARNLLLTEKERYDVIISQPSNPWIKGEASLFTREWYQLVRRGLREEGLFLQWVPSYLIGEKDLKTIAHTLHSVFPHLTVWTSGSVGDLIFLAQKGRGLKIDIHELYSRLAEKEVLTDISRIGIDPLTLPFSLYLMGEEDLISYLYNDSGSEPVMNTDNNLKIEFSAPRQLVAKNNVKRFTLTKNLEGNLDSIWEILEKITPEEKKFFLNQFGEGFYEAVEKI